ncbi:FCD domain-containing protein, partial [Acinetobacter baumannii]|nr:FCD domain-containing protein [Acinetobacter baumannii]
VIACLEDRAATNQQDVANFMLSDKKLHLAIAKATHNKALQATYEYFLNSSYQYTLELVTNKNLPDPNQQIHTELVQAIQHKSESEAMRIAESMLAPILRSLDSIKADFVQNHLDQIL